MVLAELGKKINNALDKLKNASVIDDKLINQVLGDISLALLQSDVNAKYVKKLKDNILLQLKMQESESLNTRKLIEQLVEKELIDMLGSQKKPFVPKKGRPNVVMFVGLQGVGKTTTCTKYAKFWKKKGWKTALICADTFRAAAFDQLKQNAIKIGVPFYGSYTETNSATIAEEGINLFKKENIEIIIVDTSGTHRQESDLFEEMKLVSAAARPDECIFVMDGSVGQACYDQAFAFSQAVNVGSVIVTKLDGHAKGGGALSAVAATQSPVTFIGTGEHFDYFEDFKPESFIRRLLGKGDIKGLIDIIKDQPQLIQKEQFSLRDFQGQFKSLLNIGSINQFMSMIPGLGNSFLDKNNEKESIKKAKKFLCIMDSMNDQELDGYGKISEKRLQQIAYGSGNQIEEVYLLLEEYKRLSKVFDKLEKSNIVKGNSLSNAKRNTQQFQQKMGQFLDPKMIESIGGMGNIMNLMKEGFGGGNIGSILGNLDGKVSGLAGELGGSYTKGKRQQKKK